MTNGREIGSYIAAHVMGFVLGALLTAFVMVPIYTSTGVAAHAVGRYMVSFIFLAVVQVAVFFAFIALRGRSGVPIPS
jgi:heme/copper-type cytochrome/quinol oxidase subunit 4